MGTSEIAYRMEGNFTIPAQYLYDGVVMQGNLFPREVLDRIKTMELAPTDVLLASGLKSGQFVYRCRK